MARPGARARQLNRYTWEIILPPGVSCSNSVVGEFVSVVVCDPSPGEVCVGALPTWQHQVQGDFCIIDETTIVIRHFYYDSGGPGEQQQRRHGGRLCPLPQLIGWGVGAPSAARGLW